MNRKTKLLMLILIIILIVFIIRLIFSWYGEKSTNGTQADSYNNSQQVDKMNYVGDNTYKIIRAENGFYGVFDNDDNQIISPQWNSINFLSNDRFIVSQLENPQISVGIIDGNENIVVPFIYKSIERVSDNLVIGIDKENLKFILFDNAGTPYINTEWDSCSVTNNDINLIKDGNQYTAHIEQNKLIINSMLINIMIKQKDLSVLIINCLPNVAYNTYIDMVKLCTDYINAATDYDTSVIRKLTTADYYNYLISKNIMSLMDMSEITSITPLIEETEIGFVYSCSISITEQTDDTETELILYMTKGEDGKLFLTDTKKYSETIVTS